MVEIRTNSGWQTHFDAVLFSTGSDCVVGVTLSMTDNIQTSHFFKDNIEGIIGNDVPEPLTSFNSDILMYGELTDETQKEMLLNAELLCDW